MFEKCFKYTESVTENDPFRSAYAEGLYALLARENEKAAAKRADLATEILNDRENAVTRYKNMLGWPLTEEMPKSLPAVRRTFVAESDGIRLERVQIEVLPDLWFYGLLYLQIGTEPRPLVISQHGGAGSPELCSDLYESGSANYTHMTQRLLHYGVHVFAPQLLLWNQGTYKVDYNREKIDCQLKQLGGSITALELFFLQRSLDWLEAQDFVDSSRIGMFGMSYGSMYTMRLAALDTRLKAVLAACSYDDLTPGGLHPDWVYRDAANSFFDAEVAMMIYPRKLFIQMGDHDPVFNNERSRCEYARLEKLCASVGTDWVRYSVFVGAHEVNADETDLHDMMQALLA